MATTDAGSVDTGVVSLVAAMSVVVTMVTTMAVVSYPTTVMMANSAGSAPWAAAVVVEIVELR